MYSTPAKVFYTRPPFLHTYIHTVLPFIYIHVVNLPTRIYITYNFRAFAWLARLFYAFSHMGSTFTQT